LKEKDIHKAEGKMWGPVCVRPRFSPFKFFFCIAVKLSFLAPHYTASLCLPLGFVRRQISDLLTFQSLFTLVSLKNGSVDSTASEIITQCVWQDMTGFRALSALICNFFFQIDVIEKRNFPKSVLR